MAAAVAPCGSHAGSAQPTLKLLPLETATAALRCRAWAFRYKWCHYSERFTTSDNDVKTRIGRVLPYYMNDVMIERQFDTRSARLAAKLAVNNIFNEEYESVLNRPMPRCNYELFLTVTPKFNKR